MSQNPEFPIRVCLHSDGDVWSLDDERDVACNLEWLDSDDPEESATATDNQRRRLRLLVEDLVVLRCELE